MRPVLLSVGTLSTRAWQIVSWGRRREVIFVHVLPDTDASSLEKARDAVLAIIGAAIHSLTEQRHGKTEEKINAGLTLDSYLDP